MTDNDKTVIAGLEAMGFKNANSDTWYNRSPTTGTSVYYFEDCTPRFILFSIDTLWRASFDHDVPSSVILAAVKAAVESEQ